MTEQQVFLRLHDLADGDQDGLARLSSEIRTECREPARTVLASPDRPVRAFVCRHLEELAIGEMLDAAGSADAATRVQLMEMVLDRHLVLREYLLTVLKPMLDDLTPGTPPMRTCDAAYLLARRLVSPQNDPGQFMALDERKRDAEISEWKSSEEWETVFPPKTNGS